MQTPSAKKPRGCVVNYLIAAAIVLASVFALAFGANLVLRLLDGGSASPTTSSARSAGERYETAIQSAIDDYGSAGNAVSALLAQANADMSLLSDSGWQGQLNTAFQQFDSIGDRVEALSPPSGYTDAHDDFLLMETTFDNAIDFMREGYREQDAVKILQGNDLLDEAKSFMRRGQGKLP